MTDLTRVILSSVTVHGNGTELIHGRTALMVASEVLPERTTPIVTVGSPVYADRIFAQLAIPAACSVISCSRKPCLISRADIDERFARTTGGPRSSLRGVKFGKRDGTVFLPRSNQN